MSVQAITWAYAQRGLTGSQKFVLVTLANHANEDWECWPSIESISAATGYDEKTVRLGLKVLEADRYLTREREVLKDGSLGRYRYHLDRLRMPEGGLQAVETSPKKHQGNLGAGKTPGPQKDQQKHGAGATPGPENKSRENMVRALDPVRTGAGAMPGTPTGRHARSTKPSLIENRQKEEPLSENAETRLPDVSQAFFEIWSLWPGPGRQRSKSKAMCLQVLNRVCGKVPPAQIVNAARKFIRSIDPKYAPSLDKWLREGRFEHFVEAEIEPPKNSIDWRAALRRWFETGAWPRNAGPTPDEREYAGPLDLVEALLPEFSDGHPTATAMRRMIDHRRRA